MAGISIPGVTDPYNTNDTVEKLMQVERIPLTREQNQLEKYKNEQDAWREINSKLSSLRENTKTLYSYDNPFNNKLVNSTQEDAITAEATRSAPLQSFKVDVLQIATTDRFLTNELPSDYKVPSGVYTFKVADKQLTMNWKGGSLKDFSAAINKRGNGIVNTMIIGASQGKKTLLIESLTPGKENKLIFEDAAKSFAESSGMISPIKSNKINFGTKSSEITNLETTEPIEQQGMPKLSISKTKFLNNTVTVQPRGAYQVNVPTNIKNNSNYHITFSITPNKIEDITFDLNEKPTEPSLPDSGFAEFENIIIKNIESDTTLEKIKTQPTLLSPIEKKDLVFAIMQDGSEKLIETPKIFSDSQTKIDIPISDFQNIKAIAFKNFNTGYSFDVSSFETYDITENAGYIPNNPVSVADDAIIKYEGIKITRPSNKIDDVIPEITLNLHDKTEKTATISVKSDAEAAKDALISFVGQYNQTVAKINILSQTKSEIIEELDYFTKEEKETAYKQLGIFQTDFSLTSIKSNMATILSSQYLFDDSATITMLNQIGIATNASGFGNGYSASRLRGYLEIDEKKLDNALQNNLDDIKSLFGYDSDGDLIIDSGIAYKLDKQIGAYTQTGGILSLKTSTLDSKIKNSESKISKLEQQLDNKEAEYRNQFSTMTGTLNSLESQQNTISNFSKQNQNN